MTDRTFSRQIDAQRGLNVTQLIEISKSRQIAVWTEKVTDNEATLPKKKTRRLCVFKGDCLNPYLILV